ncbi:hypothetical protein ACFL96_16635 [Thermoproteota archaeon]
MKKDILKLAAIFMSCLIITLPFYISDALAVGGSITSIKLTGKNTGAENIRGKDNDCVDVTVEVMADAAVTPQDIFLKDWQAATGIAFSTCTQVGSPSEFNFQCSYTCTPDSMANGGVFPVTACLQGCCSAACDCGTSTNCAISADMVVDETAPTVTSFDVTPTQTSGTGLTASYSVADTACTASQCAGLCSGISKVEALDANGTVLGTDSPNSTTCTASGTISFSLASAPNGLNQVCAKVYDMAGLDFTSTNCAQVTKDNTQPSITAGLYDSTGTTPLTFVNSAGTPAMIKASVNTSTVFELSSCTADLSALGLGTEALTCTGSGGIYSCSASVTLTTAASSAAIPITATDSGGNTAETSISVSFQEDSTGATLGSIRTKRSLNGTFYVGPSGNTIIVIVNESGSGLSASAVTITAGGVSYNSTCNATGNTYTCTATGVSATGPLTVSVSGADNAGNTFSDSATLAYDGQPPVIVNATIRNLADSTLTYFRTGDDILMKIFITENIGIIDDLGVYSVLGNFSGFSSPSFVNADTCAKVTGGWMCEWRIMNVAPGDIQARFNVSDLVGNSDTSTLTSPIVDFYLEYVDSDGNTVVLPGGPNPASIYGQETGTPDYWEASVEKASPNPIDAITTSIIGNEVWFMLKLTPKTPLASIMSVSFTPTSCTGAAWSSYASPSQTLMVHPTPNSTYPWIKIALNPVSIEKKNKSLTFTCSLSIVSLRGSNITLPETETVNLTVKVSEFDEISDSVEDEIDDVEHGWLVEIGDWIDTAAQVIAVIDKICMLRNVVEVVVDLMIAIAGVMCIYPPTEKAGEALVKAAENINDWVKESFLNTFCSLMACDFSMCKDKPTGPSGKKKWYCVFYTGIMEKMIKWIDENPAMQKFMEGMNKASDKAGGIGSSLVVGMGDPYDNPDETPDKFRDGFSGAMAWGSPRNSLILSILTICIPGILLKLKEMRDIECLYLLCLKTAVPAGTPVQACTMMRSYQWCVFIWGEIFHIIPFADLIKNMLAQITKIFTDPGAFIGLLLAIWKPCKTSGCGGSVICAALKLVEQLMDFIAMLKQMERMDKMFEFEETGVCATALDN